MRGASVCGPRIEAAARRSWISYRNIGSAKKRFYMCIVSAFKPMARSPAKAGHYRQGSENGSRGCPLRGAAVLRVVGNHGRRRRTTDDHVLAIGHGDADLPDANGLPVELHRNRL